MLIRFTALACLCLLCFACDESQTDAATAQQEDAGVLAQDAAMVEQADVGENCILVRDENGEWTPVCNLVDQTLATDIGSTASLSVSLLTPTAGQLFAEGAVISLSGSVITNEIELTFVAVELVVPNGEPSPVTFDRQSGLFTANIEGLPPGEHEITFIARSAPDLEASATVNITVDCGFVTDFSRPLEPELWRVLGSASLNAGGWLEMSNNQMSTSGGIFLVGRTIDAGALDVSFRISSGSGRCPTPDEPCLRPDGTPQQVSDGFAVTFWNVAPSGVDALWDTLCRCGSGAILSGATTAAIDPEDAPEGITIEFDTYPNSCPNNGFFDPVQSPHVEIQQNGRFYRGSPNLTREERCLLTDFSAEEGVTWAAYPDLVDNFWHDVELAIEDGRVRVSIDGALVLDADLPDFRFKGGVLAFSGGSGAVPAYQRFDDLSIRSGCR